MLAGVLLTTIFIVFEKKRCGKGASEQNKGFHVSCAGLIYRWCFDSFIDRFQRAIVLVGDLDVSSSVGGGGFE